MLNKAFQQGQQGLIPDRYTAIYIHFMSLVFRKILLIISWSIRPMIEMTIPSSLDSTISPKGCHVALLFTQYVQPHHDEMEF